MIQEPTVINIVPISENIPPISANMENLPKFLIIRPNPSKAETQKLSPLSAI